MLDEGQQTLVYFFTKFKSLMPDTGRRHNYGQALSREPGYGVYIWQVKCGQIIVCRTQHMRSARETKERLKLPVLVHKRLNGGKFTEDVESGIPRRGASGPGGYSSGNIGLSFRLVSALDARKNHGRAQNARQNLEMIRTYTIVCKRRSFGRGRV